MTPDITPYSFERLRTPTRLVAAREIAQAEQSASAARALNDGDEFASLTPQERIRARAIHQAFYELVELQGVADEDAEIVLELFADNPEVANATLKRIEMNGNWGAADRFEQQLLGMVYGVGYKSITFLPRESPEAKTGVIIPAGFTKEHGFVALRRKRRLIIATHGTARPSLEVDKISTFALDINGLAELSPEAVSEVRLIVAVTMFNAIDWSALGRPREHLESLPEDILFAYAKRELSHDGVPEPRGRAAITAFNDAMHLARTMDKYGMTIDELRQRLYQVAQPWALHGQASRAFVEDALHTRSNLLTPAATTYYVHS